MYPGIYNSEDDESNPNRSYTPYRSDNIKREDNSFQNSFLLQDEYRFNINKRLPVGFCLLPKSELFNLNEHRRAPSNVHIEYNPQPKERKEEADPVATAIESVWANMKSGDNGKKCSMVAQSYEGRSRQAERIKNIIQRFRKYHKYQILSAQLTKIGLLQALNQIEQQNKKGLLNIDTFKQRTLLVLETAKCYSYDMAMRDVIDEMNEQFQCYCEQARKGQFEKNIESIQKSIDKITRYVADPTDTTKSSGLTYSKKKRKPERTEPYSEKQLLYISDLIQKLPPAYLVGVWEVVEEKPFCESTVSELEVHLAELNPKKLRELELYVKGKHSLLFRSRERKAEKLQARQREKSLLGQEDAESFIQKVARNEEGLIEAIREQEASLKIEVPQQNESDNEFAVKKGQSEQPVPSVLLIEPKDEPGFEDFDPLPRGQETPKFRSMQFNSTYKIKEIRQLDKPVYEAPDESDSSDSSMITDEDDSDF